MRGRTAAGSSTPHFWNNTTQNLTWRMGPGPRFVWEQRSRARGIVGRAWSHRGRRPAWNLISPLHTLWTLVLSLLAAEVELESVCGGAITGHTQACLDGRRGTREQFSSRLASLLTPPVGSHGPFEATGYIVCQSDRKPVGCVRWDWTRAWSYFPCSIGPWSWEAESESGAAGRDAAPRHTNTFARASAPALAM